MSFTVVIKNNENGKILFASENTLALVVGAVAKDEAAVNPVTALAACNSLTADMAIAIGLAREAIENIEKDDPALKMLGPVTDAFLANARAKIIKEDGEND
jgi:hypothetical protein